MTSRGNKIRLILTLVGGWLFLFGFLLSMHAFAYQTRANGPNRPDVSQGSLKPPGTFILGYYDLGEPLAFNGSGVGDNLLRLVNPTDANGNLCAMIYVFDDQEEMGECCGCPITPNQLAQFSVANDLTSNWQVAGRDSLSGVFEVVPAPPNHLICNINGCTTICDPTIGYVPTPNLVGYITHNQSLPTSAHSSVTSLTEVSLFDSGAPDAVELQLLVSDCNSLVKNGTGHGICNCPAELSLQPAD